MFKRINALPAAIATGSLFLASQVHAAIDTSAIEATLETDGVAAVTAVAAAAIAVVVVMKVFRMIRGAM